ncbi:MAG: tRNAHis guanylyltransferase [Methanoregulaceae archaeon PtaB.Bin056]|jgi:tRNA(His) 5'-end guanylyltransferase|nr:MAG: tRNAHis guanylyltransferase [Methanoregulaceae archaeon PtaB.Bin056]
MKHRELFSNLVALPPIFLRLDGRTFHRIAEAWHLERPFDSRFAEAMARVCARLISDSGLSPDIAYTFSDEINLYFSRLPFNGRVEKLDSVCASFAASALSIEMESTEPISFDARIIHVIPEMAPEYLIQRQGEAWRNHLNAYCQYALMKEGMSRKEAAAFLKGRPSREMHELAFARGINLAHTPAWQRRGILVQKRTYMVSGFNPKLGKMAESVRSEVITGRDLPVFASPEGRALLTSLLRSP